MRYSGPWRCMDTLRHIIIILGTLLVIGLISTVHWVLAAIAAVPVYVLLLNLVGFLTLPLYYLTPERKTASELWRRVKDGDTEALRELAERIGTE